MYQYRSYKSTPKQNPNNYNQITTTNNKNLRNII